MFLGSLVGFKNAVGQNDSIQNKNIESNFSEKSFQIIGVVRDSSDNSPVPFCNVILSDKNDKQIAGATSDFDGKFKLYPIPKGNYKIHIAFVGYKPINKSINIYSDTLINFKIFSTLEKLPVMCYVELNRHYCGDNLDR